MTIARPRRRGGWSLPLLSAICLLAALGFLISELLAYSEERGRITANVRIAGVDVSNLSPEQASTLLQQQFLAPIPLYYRDSPILLDPQALGFRVDTDALVAAAIDTTTSGSHYWSGFWGRLFAIENPTSVSIPLQSEYQTTLLRNYLQDLARRYDSAPGSPVNDLVALQTRPGESGYMLDIEASIPLIDAALRTPNREPLPLPILTSEAQKGKLSDLRQLIIDYLDSEGFLYDGVSTLASVFILDLTSGEELHILSDVPFSAASLSKLAVMLNYYRQEASPPDADEAFLLANSLLCSNNSSTNLLLQTAGRGEIFNGLADTNRTIAKLGTRNSFITAPYDLGTGETFGSIQPPETSPNPNFDTAPDPFNQTTSEDLGNLFTMIYDCANHHSGAMSVFPNGEYTPTECRQMLELMSANDLERLLQGGIPPETRFSHKNGWDGHQMHGDAGIVHSPNGRDYVIAVLVWENSDFFSYEIAWPLIEDISRAAWNHFNPERPLLSRRSDLPNLAVECAGNYLPPYGKVNLNDINAWREGEE